MPDDIWNPYDLESLRALGRGGGIRDESAKVLLGSLRLKPEPPTTTDSSNKGKRTRREAEPFVHVTERELLAGLRVLHGAQELAVWLFILRERRVREAIGQPMSFALTNASLVPWGIGKHTKARAIRKLAAAGLIMVERDGFKSPQVTVCEPL
jgi:hypothetical protein